jgi:hypothetical protein
VSIIGYDHERLTIAGHVLRRRVQRRQPEGAYITVMMTDSASGQAAEFTWLHCPGRLVPSPGQRITLSGRLASIPKSPVSIIGVDITASEQEAPCSSG